MGKLINIVGQKYGRLTVIEYAGKFKDGHMSAWRCKCDCGNEVVVIGRNLKNGNTKSCGCIAKEINKNCDLFKKHGYSGTKLYAVWKGIIQRCFNKNNKEYKNYGGRGITICREWKNDFVNFYDWAISNGYEEKLTIDRINVNGNYEPSNCRWATTKTQSRNRRNNHYITYRGETKTIKEWSEALNIDYNALLYKINYKKMSLEKIIATME